VLEGFAGTTTSTLKMAAGLPAGANPCEVTDNGTGTVTLPPAGCEYLSPDEVHMIIDGLPPGTTIELAAIHKDFICRGDQQGTPNSCSVSLPPGTCEAVGGGLGGNLDCFDSVAQLVISGTGALGTFSRTISVPLFVEIHTGPRTPGDPVQSFPTEMVALEGQIFGDPDFDVLVIRAGSSLGLPPSPGQTTLTDTGNGTFTVDSFFDIAYEIDFQGAPGGQLDGLSGSSAGTIQMGTGAPPSPTAVPALAPPTWLLLLGGLMLTGGAMLVRRRRAVSR
jgi:LPXTG-motif cell wall-anchored protein